MTKQTSLVGMVSDGDDLFIVLGDKQIAKRGHPGTPQAKTWISLETRITVWGGTDLSEIVVEINGVRIH